MLRKLALAYASLSGDIRLHAHARRDSDCFRDKDLFQSPQPTMDNDDATQCTQGVVDPRRMGRNNSGLTEADISDVMCILHPCSPAAFQIVATTAELSPQNVLQNDGFGDHDDVFTKSVLEEQETFILIGDGPTQAMDLALRFTARTINQTLGFVFGRNERMCDIVLATDTHKRVSNMHFSIFMNDHGVLMLQDMSTNGTMVDDVLLKGKTAREPQTRMLNPGSIIQILSPKPDEIVKFVVRIPSREGHVEAYEGKFKSYIDRFARGQATKTAENERFARRLAPAQTKTQSGGSIKAPLVHNQYGMHWTGGDKYNVVGLIGKGAFATVYQLATKSEGHLFAAKELEKRKFMKNGVLDRKLDNEMQIMKAISHPNIVQYVDYHDYANHLYIIMEFVPCGDLQHYLGLQGPLSEALGRKMAAQVLDSLAYLHAKKITHRDIKPDNILLANMDPDHFTVKLSDFGLSKVVKDNDTFLKTFCGTLLYCAPEVFPHYDAHVAGRGQKRARKGNAQQPSKFHSYSQCVDIWSFGAVVWYSLCLKPPFEGVADNTGRGMFEKIMMTPLDPTDLVKQGISDIAVALLADMLNTDPASRPSPAQCLRHQWFGQEQSTGQGATEVEQGLVAIAEEEEEGGEELGVSQLSLSEHGSGDSQDNPYYDEASIHSGSMNFFDPRQSKRFKSNAFTYREQADAIDSSAELLHRSLHIGHPPNYVPPPKPLPAHRKLFGEISRSTLGAPFTHSLPTPDVTQNGAPSPANGSSDSADRAIQTMAGAGASPSLLGAESLMRDVHMNSPRGTDSPSVDLVEPIEPKTPITSERPRHANGTPHNDITPKQRPHATFNRQINIPLPASFFFDPNDPTTHTLEYASKVSGHDFLANPSYVVNKRDISLPATVSGDATEEDHDEYHGEDTDIEAEAPPLLQTPTNFIKPPPRLGRLVSTSDSFVQIRIDLSLQITTWGRAPNNTHVYPDARETRVPKRGIIVYFHAPDIEKKLEQDEWLKLPDLHCGIATGSSAGIWVNGVMLHRGEPGKTRFGRIYTGDEITVCNAGMDKPGLKFRCEFFHGEAKERRPAGAPKFVVETEGSSRSTRTKGKEKGKTVAMGELAAA